MAEDMTANNLTMTADDLFNALGQKFPPREYALLSQVRNCTGFGLKIRTADALCMSLWPSRGLELAGIEIKIERRDWVREKGDPDKADAIGKYCDRWWIVTPPGVVQLEELPPAWGLMEFDGEKGKWKIRQPAAKLKAKPLTRDFLAGILRNVSETAIPHAAIEGRIQEAIEKDREARKYEMKHLKEENETLNTRIREFEAASGVSIGATKWSWHEPKEIGLAVRQVLNGDHKRIVHRLQSLKGDAEGILQDLTKRLEGVQE